jgi:hypothetical protein
MVLVTLIFAVLLAGLGLGSYLGTGSMHPTLLIPLWFGIVFGVFGFLAMRSKEGSRKLFMHINVTIAVLGFLGAIAGILHSVASAKELDMNALAALLVLGWLLLIYVILCVRSFLTARQSEAIAAMRKVKE